MFCPFKRFEAIPLTPDNLKVLKSFSIIIKEEVFEQSLTSINLNQLSIFFKNLFDHFLFF